MGRGGRRNPDGVQGQRIRARQGLGAPRRLGLRFLGRDPAVSWGTGDHDGTR